MAIYLTVPPTPSGDRSAGETWADHGGAAAAPGALLARLGRRDAGGAAAAAARGGRRLGGPGALGQRRPVAKGWGWGWGWDDWDGMIGMGWLGWGWSISSIFRGTL